MGCSCYKLKSSHEKLIDDVFWNFILRKKEWREIEYVLTLKGTSHDEEKKPKGKNVTEIKNQNDETQSKVNDIQVSAKIDGNEDVQLPKGENQDVPANTGTGRSKPRYLNFVRKASKKFSPGEKQGFVINEQSKKETRNNPTTGENLNRDTNKHKDTNDSDPEDYCSYITETTFQECFNSFLNVNSSCSYSDDILPIFNYWFDFYRSKPYKTQVPFIKFTLALLCQPAADIDSDIHTLLTIFRQYDTITFPAKKNSSQTQTMRKQLESPNDSVKSGLRKQEQIKEPDKKLEMSYNQMFELLKDYIYSISFMTVEHLMNLSNQGEEFYACLISAWNPSIIDEFIVQRLLGESSEINVQFNVKRFLKKNIRFLRDDELIRKELTEFSIHYREENKEKIIMKDYKILNEDNLS